jgi:hypothetical protein
MPIRGTLATRVAGNGTPISPIKINSGKRREAHRVDVNL